MVPAHSHRVSRVPWYSGFRAPFQCFAYGAFTLSGRSFQFLSAASLGKLVRSIPRRASRSGLGSFPFARRYLGNRFFFLFLRLLRCFSSPGSLPCTIMALLPLFMHGYMESFHVGSPIQISAAHGIFAPPRGFSQLITSFIGSQCQGIRPAPFLLNLSCLPYSVTGQFSGLCFFLLFSF